MEKVRGSGIQIVFESWAEEVVFNRGSQREIITS